MGRGKKVVVRTLDHVSFQFHQGGRVGLIGHNGSGKSTLLRVLAGAYEPVGGTLQVNGRVASMLSLTLGIDTEATGHENVCLISVLSGMSNAEIERRKREIEAFTELGAYLDMPMRTYSSGMTMRIGFAIATSVDADIILMDEWVSVGDAHFVERADQPARVRRARRPARARVAFSRVAAQGVQQSHAARARPDRRIRTAGGGAGHIRGEVLGTSR